MYIVILRRVRANIVGMEQQGHILRVCVSVNLNTQHKMLMRHNVIGELSSSTLSFQIISYRLLPLILVRIQIKSMFGGEMGKITWEE